jgi:hypothetical protein
MKDYFSFKLSLISWVLTLTLLILSSCGKWTVPVELVGDWKSGKHLITVRVKLERGEYEFISDSAVISFTISDDNTVSGSIGDAAFKDGTIRKNWGNPEKTGLAHIIECGSIGKIFENDPLENKEVELWLAPLRENIDAELRYTQRCAQFPMAGIRFTKED